MLKGIGVSDGIGIGRVMILAEQSLDYTPKEITDVEAELARYRDAVDKFCDNTVEQANAIRQSTGDKEAEILEGHIAIIRDPFMGGEIENLIKANQCAEAAVDQICKMFIDMFSATGDDLTMQRAADVRDIRDGILGILLGVQEVKISDAPAGTVLVVKELTPSMTAGIKKENIVGIIAETGSQTSHSAILARALEIPAALSVPNATTVISSQEIVIVDGFRGSVLVAPDAEKVEEFTAKRTAYLREKRELETLRGKATADADGNEYELFCNIGTPKDATKAMEADGEGVGLFRTEFLFMDRNQLPTEDEQFEAYKQASLIMKGKPVIIRTLDIGGDKEIPYLGLAKEENPFMGFRAIRYCLKNRDMFKSQIKAILRASAFGDIRIMFPLITAVDELRAGKALVEEAKADLKASGIAYDENIQVGVMTETAASGVIADLLAKEADFFSIGTNDLIQYSMAADRMSKPVSYLYQPLNPSILRLIKMTIDGAHKNGKWCGMCGEMAGDELAAPVLLGLGLDEFSMSATSILRARRMINGLSYAEMQEMAAKAVECDTAEEVTELIKNSIGK